MADTAKALAELDRLTKAEEGWRAAPYLCPSKVPTIGNGCTSYEDGTKVKLTDPPITRERGQALLDFKLREGVHQVITMTNGQVSTNQLVALVLCGFNIGWPALQGSSMIKAHKRGDFEAAARSFSLWNNHRPGGRGTPLVEHPVLTARRRREAAIYSLPEDHAEQIAADAVPAVPQAVEPESKMRSSPTNKAAIGLTVAGVVKAVTDWGDGATAIKPAVDAIKAVADVARGFAVDTLGVPPDRLLPYGCIAVGLFIVYWRVKARRGGWS
jgi:lysozyme